MIQENVSMLHLNKWMQVQNSLGKQERVSIAELTKNSNKLFNWMPVPAALCSNKLS